MCWVNYLQNFWPVPFPEKFVPVQFAFVNLLIRRIWFCFECVKFMIDQMSLVLRNVIDAGVLRCFLAGKVCFELLGSNIFMRGTNLLLNCRC